MKLLNAAIFLLTLLVFASGCRNKTGGQSNDCLSKLDFTKITSMDETGNMLSKDLTDWTNDSLWCAREYGLFNTGNLDLTGSDSAVLFTVLFPNPLIDRGMLVVIRQKPCLFQCVIVDRSFLVLDTFSIPNRTGTMIVERNFADSLKYRHGQYYRMYYAAHSTGKLFFYKGHGDFKIQ